MIQITESDYIKCYFDPEIKVAPVLAPVVLQVFYSEIKDLDSRYSHLKNYISIDEQLRADKFLSNKDRQTYILCHAILRILLADQLNTNPSTLSFISGKNNKPGLKDDPVHFNISHSGEAFAIIVSKHFYIGIDIEIINPAMDFYSIIKRFFSKREREFIMESPAEMHNRFYLLWTRKEALLKALGVGIIDNLTQIEVSGSENFIRKSLFDDLISESILNEHYIYSKKLHNYCLSIAIPGKASINLNHLNNENIVSYLDLK